MILLRTFDHVQYLISLTRPLISSYDIPFDYPSTRSKLCAMTDLTRAMRLSAIMTYRDPTRLSSQQHLFFPRFLLIPLACQHVRLPSCCAGRKWIAR
jgi:hypothetical protein